MASAGATLVLAGCGAGGAGTGTGTANNPAAYSVALKYANCMRSHGVPDFPDPGAGGGVQINAAPGVAPQSPAYTAATRACRRFGPGMAGPPHPLPAAQRRKLIAFSRCMRSHGVPTFPDPKFPASGGAMIGAPQPSPAFQHAAVACGHPLK